MTCLMNIAKNVKRTYFISNLVQCNNMCWSKVHSQELWLVLSDLDIWLQKSINENPAFKKNSSSWHDLIMHIPFFLADQYKPVA